MHASATETVSIRWSSRASRPSSKDNQRMQLRSCPVVAFACTASFGRRMQPRCYIQTFGRALQPGDPAGQFFQADLAIPLERQGVVSARQGCAMLETITKRTTEFLGFDLKRNYTELLLASRVTWFCLKASLSCSCPAFRYIDIMVDIQAQTTENRNCCNRDSP